MSGNVRVIASADGKSFSEPMSVSGPTSYYGLQMANYRGELYGVVVKDDKQLAATKFKATEGWKSFRTMPELYKSQGRCAVTVLDDRFFVAYRGTNDGVYLVWTEDFSEWHDAGRVGSTYAKSMVAPAMVSYNGQLYIAGVGPDKYIYYTTCTKEGKKNMSWTKIDGTGTQSALTMAVFDGDLYLFHTAYNNGAFFYQALKDDASSPATAWTSLSKVTTSSITSGLSAVSWKYNQLAVTYRGSGVDDKMAVIIKYFNGEDWSHGVPIPGTAMLSQTGLSTWGGMLAISYGSAESSSSYRTPRAMCEKSAFNVQENEVAEWDCKWQQGEPAKKSLIQKFFCM